MHDHRILDLATLLSAGIAAVSLANAALAVTIIAGVISIICGIVRLYDRLKYGPVK